MTDVLKKLADLSPERRKLLELRMKLAQQQAAGPELKSRPRTGDAAPLSFAQQRLWLLDRLDPGSAHYNMSHPLRIRGALDVRALETALDGLRERHETLRTTFEERGGGPVQVIHPPAHFDLPVDDLSHLPESDREAEVVRRVNEDGNTGFDLERGPLFRVHLLRLADEDHVLLLCMHHVISDGWSLGVLWGELRPLYEAALANRPPALAPLPVQYADFALWQREALRGEALEKQISFWRKALDGAPPALELPADRPRPPSQSHRGSTLRHPISPELAEALRELARAEGATLFHVLLAGLRVVLARHAGQDDVVIGTPVAGRTRGEVEGLIGFFVNTLALSGSVAGDPAFRDLVAREKAGALAAFAHQDLPFDRVVEELHIARDNGRNPVFQAMMTLQNARMDVLRLPGCVTEPLRTEYETAKFDVTFDIYEEEDGGLRAEVEYATDLFDAATIERMARRLETLLADAARRPEAPVSALRMLTDEERRTLLDEWSGSEQADYQPETLHALFEAQAARTPDSPALRYAGETVPFAELNARANRLARHLRSLGIGRESLVAVSLERSPEMVVALLAAVKAGGAFLPVDPKYPRERRAYMLEDSGARVVVTRSHLVADLPETDAHLVVLDQQASAIESLDASNLAAEVDPENAAYVIYTSGSTGKPKGVVVPHRGIKNLVEAQAEAFGIDATSRVLQFASFSFDAAVAEIAHTLLSGACLVLPTDAQAMPGRELLGLLTGERVSVATLPPSVLAAMDEGGLPDLKTIVSAGEAVSSDVVRRWGAGRRYVNAYGPTETTVCATLAIDPDTTTRPPIGKPIRNLRAYVLDAAMQPVPVGVPGELYVGGVGVARGYLNRPELTAERFVPDPFSGREGARLYRTGDRARWRADGDLEFLGRADDQVKVRGFRIEPGEIESILLDHPSVREAVAMARGGSLLAWIVADSAADVAEVRAHAAARLPEYMVPSAVIRLDALPLTPNGKVDRRALPDPDADGENYTPPETPTQETLAGIWAEVLHRDRVGADHDFFFLGGHSLVATQVVARVRQALSVEIPLRALFEAPKLRDLAARVDELLRAGGEEASDIVPVPREGPLVVSFAQERVWFLERLVPEAGVYNVPVRLLLEGALDAEALRRSVEAVVARHEALRTVYIEVDGAPMQRILPPKRFDLRVVAATEGEMMEDVDRDAWEPFDLERGPMIRATLYRLGPDEHVLSLNMHHSVSDGWSVGVMFREMERLYPAFLRGEEPVPEPLEVQYADFAAWQRGWLVGERLEAQVEYWRRRLAGHPARLELPADHARPAKRTYRGSTLRFQIDAALTRRVREVGASEQATLYMTLLAAYQAVLGRWSGDEDLVVGSPLAGRGRGETESMIGFFVNMLAMRADLSGAPSFRELLRRTREATLGAYAHQDVPFERLVDELKVERDLSHAPVFQVSFALQNAAGAVLGLPGVEASFLEVEDRAAKIDLALEAEEAGDELTGILEYAADLFEPATPERLVRHWIRFLEAATANPDAPIWTLDLRDDDDRARLSAWSHAESVESQATLHAAFEANAAATPNAPAIVSADGSTLTYADADARANRLARRLRAAGVGPETMVGVHVPRSPDLVVSLLAVLKAGGVYVPLDPDYPADRLAYVLEDSRAAVVVARGALPEATHGFGGTVVSLDSDADAIESEPADRLHDVAVDPSSAAYVIHTSGSTGKPKGVVVQHGEAAAHMRAAAAFYALTEDDRVLQFAAMSFDPSLEQILAPLSAGAAVVLRGAEVPSPAELARFVAERGVTVLNPPTAWWHSLVDDAEALASVKRTVRLAIAGGEAMSPAAAATWAAAPGDARLLNAYGPTEAVVTCAAYEVPAGFGSTQPEPRVPIGGPLPGRSIYILGPGDVPAAVGVPGELCVGGLLARGYLHRVEATEEAFVRDPFSARPNARMYRTGDRARWREDGALEFLGRLDEQVKVRGFRVEPGEVEAALRALPGVADAAVVPREAAPGDLRLVAYVVGRDGAAPSGDTLASALRSTLPAYLVPSAFVNLPALPLTPTGKVDRRALPEPQFASAEAFEPPATATEEVLAAIWSEVLGVERVGRRDRFFDLGGHSLLATKVLSRLRQALHVDLPVRELFDQPSLSGLAERVDRARQREGGVPEAPIERVSRGGELPLSFAQERMWFIARLQPESPAYNMPFTVRLRGRLDAEALRRTLGEIVRRHEALRTVFKRGSAGNPIQVVQPAGELDLPLTDLSHLPNAEEEAARVAEEDARRPFDLERGPIFRARLLRLGESEHLLLLAMHHIVGDGWSTERLFAETGALYRAFSRGESSPLPEPPVQYADYAAWQRGWLKGETLDRQLSYWRARLAGAPTLDLPTDHPRPPVTSERGAHHGVEILGGVAEALEQTAREEAATPFMALMAAYALLLRRWSGQDDVVIGTPVAGRDRPEVEPLIGLFVNTVALRADLSGDPTFRELLGRMREAVLEAYAHQDLPFERLVEELKVERTLSRHPVFQVLFVMQKAPDAVAEEADAGVHIEVESADTASTKFDLMLAMTRTPRGLWATFEYATDLFEGETIGRMGAHFRLLLESVAADPDVRASDLLGRMDEADRVRVIERWNDTAAELDGRPVHAAFADTAARAPQSVAVVADAPVTYGELDARANRLAHHLRALGVGAESRVGLLVDRTPDALAGMLAILKAGGACVPLDAAHPSGRLRHALGDSDIRVVVTPAASAAANLPKTGARVVALDADAEAIAGQSADDPRVAVDADSLAFVLYSGGATGLPRGVLLPHRAAANAARALAHRLEVTPCSRVLQVASLTQAGAAPEAFAALTTGAALVMAPAGVNRGAALAGLLRRERITHAVLPARVLAGLGEADLPDLKSVAAAGEALVPGAAARWARDRALVNLFGMTETAGAAAAADAAGAGKGAVGRGVANARLYVLDESLRALPPGVVGELYVAGEGVARGYQGRPRLTAEKFLPDPFSDAGARMFRTGDRARWRADGQLELLGRMDEPMVVRGARVDAAEIEAALGALEGVRDAAVALRKEAGAERLVAYVTASEGAALNPESIREKLADRLPDLMVPAAVVVLPELPLTAAGKVDRRALPAPEPAAAAGVYEAPRGELERTLAAVWQEVLGRETVGVNDNFFEIGGHSLLLAQLQERLERALDRPVKMVDLFRYPTVATFAAKLDGEANAGVQEAPQRGQTRGAARREALLRRGR